MTYTESNTFFTSDLHFDHANIIKYCNRPFSSINHMNTVLVNEWNRVVKEGDNVFICGDFCFGSKQRWRDLLNMLNGNKYLIIGNHDKEIPANTFAGVKDRMNIKVYDSEIDDIQEIILDHYPMLTWKNSHRGSWNLFGHVHSINNSFLTPSNNQYDVGVDNNNFAPISYLDVKTKITQQNLNRQ